MHVEQREDRRVSSSPGVSSRAGTEGPDDASASLRNVEYSILLVMSELSTVRYDRVLGLWLQVHGHRVSTESCRGRAQAER